MHFQISPLLVTLFGVNYRVRRYIATCLSRRLSVSTLEPSIQAPSPSLTFQLAICYHTGFGIPQNFEKSRALLGQGGSSYEDLEEALNTIRTYQRPSTRNSNISSYIGSGYLYNDLTQHYREHQ